MLAGFNYCKLDQQLSHRLSTRSIFANKTIMLNINPNLFHCQPTFQVCISANVPFEVDNIPGMPNHHCEQQTLLIFLPEEAEIIQI